MFLESLGMATLLWATLWATYGESYWAGGVIKIEEYKDLGLWHIVVYGGGPENRRINPAVIRHVVVDSKAKDPVTGRLLLDEMRDLMKTMEIAIIDFNWRNGVGIAVRIEKFMEGRIRLNLEEELP